ncbi:hypothetical protein DFH09DRAFT_1073215 [Mycena vulgaris]|nr:hypothetical protein DFH09DRAFT_1073215 [Mycena vulgaris]
MSTPALLKIHYVFVRIDEPVRLSFGSKTDEPAADSQQEAGFGLFRHQNFRFFSADMLGSPGRYPEAPDARFKRPEVWSAMPCSASVWFTVSSFPMLGYINISQVNGMDPKSGADSQGNYSKHGAGAHWDMRERGRSMLPLLHPIPATLGDDAAISNLRNFT